MCRGREGETQVGAGRGEQGEGAGERAILREVCSLGGGVKGFKESHSQIRIE